jgi:hypothetical protein
MTNNKQQTESKITWNDQGKPIQKEHYWEGGCYGKIWKYNKEGKRISEELYYKDLVGNYTYQSVQDLRSNWEKLKDCFKL